MSSRVRTLARSTIVRTVAAGGLAATLAVAGVAAATDDEAADVQGVEEIAAEEVAALDELQLPDAFQPEGIAIGEEPVAFFGSLANGDIFAVDLTTGEGEIIAEGPGTQSVGLKVDAEGRLFVAGGAAGDARVIDTATGDELASFDLAEEEETFVNDVVLTPDAAFFTDSVNAVLYKLPLVDGELPAQEDVEIIELAGDFELADGFNTNGIALAPDGESLIIVQSGTGLLFSVDAESGEATQTEVVAEEEGAELVTNGDGLLVIDDTLFVVRNQEEIVTQLTINEDGTEAELVAELTDDRFDVPTTVAAFEDKLFLPNARFGTEVEEDTEFIAVGIDNPLAAE